jgi:hypothetical protein
MATKNRTRFLPHCPSLGADGQFPALTRKERNDFLSWSESRNSCVILQPVASSRWTALYPQRLRVSTVATGSEYLRPRRHAGFSYRVRKRVQARSETIPVSPPKGPPQFIFSFHSAPACWSCSGCSICNGRSSEEHRRGLR